MTNKIWLIATIFLLMLCSSAYHAKALVVLEELTEVDHALLDSLNNNYYSFRTTVYNDTWQTFINYEDTAIITFSPEVDEINKVAAFSIGYLPFENGGVNLSSTAIPDNFTIIFSGYGSSQVGNCTSFLQTGKCIIWYKLTRRQHYGDNSSFQDVYQETVNIVTNRIPWNMSNLTFSLYQFESPAAMTFREKAMSNMTNNALSLQEKTLAIADKFTKTVDWSYQILLIMYWMFVIGIIFTAMLLVFSVPLKMVDFINKIKKKYVEKR